MKRFFYFLSVMAIAVTFAACGGPSGDPKEDATAMIKEMGEAMANADDADDLADEICDIQVKYAKAYVDVEENYRKLQDELGERGSELRETLNDAIDANKKLTKKELQEAFSKGSEKAEDKISRMLDEAQK